MSDWENAACLLCLKPAIRHVFLDPRGCKYDKCSGGCPPYAAKGGVHEHIRLFVGDLEQKKRIADLVKRRVADGDYEDKFYEITFDDLRELGLKHDP